tara:strand:- start:223 stop:1278 length:1056 start_codon:yes stop_codon:yes gene_type:complete
MLKNRKIIFNNFDKKKPIDVFEIKNEDFNDEIKNDRILIKILKAMIHPCDLGCASGYVNGIILPSVAGFEAIGEIKNFSNELKNKFYIGQKVHVCSTHILGKWKVWQGIWSDYIILKQNQIIPIPQDIRDDDALQLFVNVMTPFAMYKEMNLKKGDFLLQTAANSVVGRVMIQLGKIYGFETINIVRNGESLNDLKKSYGIENVYVYDGKNDDDIYFSIKKEYKEIKFVIDAVSGDLGTLCWKVLSPDGVFYSYGALSNVHNINVDIVNDLCRENKTMKGWSIQGTWLKQKNNSIKLKTINEIWDLFRSKELILPPLGKSFEMESFREAILESMKPKKEGKITLNINSKKI